MKFRSGKYKGLDLAVVKRRDPRYVEWVRLNRPEMLRATPTQKPQTGLHKTSKTERIYVDPPDIPRADWIPPGSLEDAF
jgi:hypothetical protein